MEEAQQREALGVWNPEVPGHRVRQRDNPGRQGVTTGRTKQAGSYLLVEVDFGPNEKQFKRYELLEPVENEEEIFELLAAERYGAPIDLRRILTLEKVRGDLTNVFYSMEASNTEFYAHQFKPVLKFIESPVGRLLIADEVGLGKTIEAAYIWKELQARENARRWLIVCPAMLQHKWRDDLRRLFNIAADIVRADFLLEQLSELAKHQDNKTFVYIASLEGLRPPQDFEDEEKTKTNKRARLARLLDQNVATDAFALFDFVVLDEAHYLRNPATASNRLGKLLREAANHMALLTATPIQIASDNLYQLLRLIDEDEFYDSTLFGEMLNANAPIVRALRSLWRLPPDVETARTGIAEALSSPYFTNDAVLRRAGIQVASATQDTAMRVEIVRLLESRSLLGQYMTRSRKREALERKIERKAQSLTVTFSSIEQEIYDRVTQNIRVRSVGQRGVSLFALIARQRQMASSLVAALESWRERGLLAELLWEDLGRSIELDDETVDNINFGDDEIAGNHFNLDALEKKDRKYSALHEFLKGELNRNPQEKFVIFAFFRGTLNYLERRLRQDGIRTALIMGGMGEEKDAILQEFRREDGPSVLLSSEVGSEGIDLQFCRIIVNYDLPWNPMRVEQRIGRLDRLGQKAESISIVNLVLKDTIEDRILMRLYERIELFRDSIGDLEEILGETTERLMLELLDPNLSDADRDRKAKAAEQSILYRRKEQERLEQEAVNLIGFSDYIIEHIKESRKKGRWLSAEELISLVEDFFARKYPGTKIERQEAPDGSARLRLSDKARNRLRAFIAKTKPGTRTRLHQWTKPILCLFDPRRAGNFGRDVEMIEPTHPLIQWIRGESEEEQQMHPISAIRLASENAPIQSGDYVFVAHRWSFAGLRQDHFLSYRAISLGSDMPLDETESEDLVVAAARHGQTFPNARGLIGEPTRVIAGARLCESSLDDAFGERLKDFEAENELRCNQQETSARRFAERRIGELEARLHRFRAEGKLRPIPATEGLLRKEKEQLKTKLGRIQSRRNPDSTLKPLAAGVIRVE